MKNITPNIALIDPNFKLDPNVTSNGLVFHNANKDSFKIHGLIHENSRYRRFRKKWQRQ